jgi:hypothetical protein|tara:strand:- start:4328 stop:5341 length:1014 start_codon:yes stop_codon:yes gene_type:complete
MKNIISISGFGWSGSTAARDLLREYSEITHFTDKKNFFKEYSLSYDPNGFIDLYSKLVQNWNFLNVDKAIKDHVTYFNSISSKKNFINYHGLHLDDFFKVNSKSLHKQFINKITLFNYTFSSRVNSLYKSIPQKLVFKIINRTGYYNQKSLFSNITEEDFFLELRVFHKNMFNQIIEKNDLMLEKAVPVNNINLVSNFFDNLKVLIVDRDPRDTFVEMSKRKTLFWGDTRNITNEQVLNFAQWKKAMSTKGGVNEIPFNKLIRLKSDALVLKIKFEELVLNYENIKPLIEELVDKTSNDHICKYDFFDPKKSKNNIGIWKNYHNQNHINIISKVFRN